jgi:hypothetical protein
MPDYHHLRCYEHIKLMLTEGCSNTDMRLWAARPKNVGPSQQLPNLPPQGLLSVYEAEYSIILPTVKNQ